MKKWISYTLSALITIYLVGGLALYFFQEKILFQPTTLNLNDAFKFSIPHKEYQLRYNQNTQISLVEFKPTSTAKGLVIYFHGNRDNIKRYAKHATNFTQYQYEVWMMDYPGFGKSTGVLTEELLYKEANFIYQRALKRFSPENIVIYGKSMGTGIASQLAAHQPCKYLILETPYYSITSLAQNYVPFYPVQFLLKFQIPTYQYLKQTSAPVFIFHGTADKVIPYQNATLLKNVLKENDEFITIPKGKHWGIPNSSLYQEKLAMLFSGEVD